MRIQLRRAIATAIAACALTGVTSCGGEDASQDEQIVEQDEQDDQDDEEQEDDGDEQDD